MTKFKLFTLTTILLLSTLSYSQSIDYLDSKNGYKDLKFGMTKTELKNNILDCTKDGHCIIVGDKYKTIRNVNIESTIAAFMEDKLFLVVLFIEGNNNVSNLLNIYADTFGKASYSKGTTAYWEGKNVLLSYEISVDDKANVSAIATIANIQFLNKNSINEIKKNLNGL
jgi:hypothetical protein